MRFSDLPIGARFSLVNVKPWARERVMVKRSRLSFTDTVSGKLITMDDLNEEEVEAVQ